MIKTNQDEPMALPGTGVASAATHLTHDVVQTTEVVNLGNMQELSGKDTECPKVDNCSIQLKFAHSGGIEGESPSPVRPHSGARW